MTIKVHIFNFRLADVSLPLLISLWDTSDALPDDAGLLGFRNKLPLLSGAHLLFTTF